MRSPSGEKATAKSVADAIAENRAELVHLPSSMDLHLALPSKDCPSCDGSVRAIFEADKIKFPTLSGQSDQWLHFECY